MGILLPFVYYCKEGSKLCVKSNKVLPVSVLWLCGGNVCGSLDKESSIMFYHTFNIGIGETFFLSMWKTIKLRNVNDCQVTRSPTVMLLRSRHVASENNLG